MACLDSPNTRSPHNRDSRGDADPSPVQIVAAHLKSPHVLAGDFGPLADFISGMKEHPVPTRPCPRSSEVALIDAYASGELADAKRAEFESHMFQCPDCAVAVRERQALIGALEADSRAPIRGPSGDL